MWGGLHIFRTVSDRPSRRALFCAFNGRKWREEECERSQIALDGVSRKEAASKGAAFFMRKGGPTLLASLGIPNRSFKTEIGRRKEDNKGTRLKMGGSEVGKMPFMAQ